MQAKSTEVTFISNVANCLAIEVTSSCSSDFGRSSTAKRCMKLHMAKPRLNECRNMKLEDRIEPNDQ